jgi:hypothetical protein
MFCAVSSLNAAQEEEMPGGTRCFTRSSDRALIFFDTLRCTRAPAAARA